LPSVIQSVKPYVSSEDIDKGSRWSTDIAKELEASTYGILCITKDNINAPWINFEAGALSKTIDKAKVTPFLFNVKRSEVQGPLLQFQSTIFEKDDISKLIVSINNSQDESDKLDELRLKKVFDVWWSQLNDQLNVLHNTKSDKKDERHKESTEEHNAILEELLDLARNQQKILRSPEVVLPPEYINRIVELSQREPNVLNVRLLDVIRDLRARYDRVLERVEDIKKAESVHPEHIRLLDESIVDMGDVIRHLHRRMRDPRFSSREISRTFLVKD
jgi:hypothetical protein